MEPTDLSRPELTGQQISHYRILRKLGAGGMGEIYQAEDLRLRRPVAIKLIIEEMGRSEEARQRFIREARAASALNHPNIATIHEVDEADLPSGRISFIVMEYVEGINLSDYVRRRDLGVGEILDLGMQVAGALQAAHQKGIVHRDVKPANILVTEDKRVKVLDFGLAKMRPESSAVDQPPSAGMLETQPGIVLGTLSYLSPEQALGRDVDSRSDIFALGILLYELLTGRLPFRGASTLAILDSILHSEPPLPSRFNPDLMPELERIIGKMLEKDRERRYQSLREVIADLAVIGQQLENRGQQDSDSSLRSRTRVLSEFPRDPRTSTLMARQGKSLAVLAFANITKNQDDDWLGSGIAETVTADLKAIQGVTVIGRERVFEVLRALGREAESIPDEQRASRIGREVGAQWIVVGGYQRLGEHLRITARFVEVETGEVIRTVKIDGRMDQIFELQDKIVFELSRNLQLGLRSSEWEGIAQEETHILGAFEAFTKGMINLRIGSSESLDRAMLLFEQAVRLDPQYAQAHASLGSAYELKAHFLNLPQLFERAIEQYQKAIELRPTLADGYRGLGMTFLYLGREEEALGATRRAIALAPDDFMAHAGLGRIFFIGKADFAEAATAFEKALSLNPKAGWIALQLAYCRSLLGDMKGAEEAARQAVTLQDQFQSGREGLQIVGAHARLGHVFALQGRTQEAIEAYRVELDSLQHSSHALRDRNSIEVYCRLASALQSASRKAEAEEAFQQAVRGFQRRLELGADEPYTRYYLACVHAVMGHVPEALDHLEIAAKDRPRFVLERARRDPHLAAAWGDPRFESLLKTLPGP